jgi:hypothetical protein
MNSSSLSTTSTGLVSSANAGGNAALSTPGSYWACVNSDNGTVVTQMFTSAGIFQSWMFGSATENHVVGLTNAVGVAITATQTFNTWPDLTSATFSESTTSNGAALIHFKAA